MEIPKHYDPAKVEEKWYATWMEHDLFHSLPDDRIPYTIVIPPPNVTGVLHMGHMLNNTIQDILIRKARMEGKNACWVPGTDHASIATEAKVVAMLRERGIKKSDLTREEFLRYAWEWKEKHGGIILQQLKKLGASCDWKRTRFTMDPDLTEAVMDCFIDLYHRGYIYRGKRMIHWDCEAKTALSDEEVIYQEQKSKLYYIRYYLVDDASQYLVVATTRPETLLGDVAVCVHPEDERYQRFVGKKVYVPLIRREVPVIADPYVDKEFGTGCLKITPAHDPNDYEIGQKHHLPVIDIFTDAGCLNENAQILIGQERFEARKNIVALLMQQNLLEKQEDIVHTVGYSERTHVVVEPRLSLQWFVNMKKFMADYPQVLDAVMQDEIRFYPSKFKNLYKHWIENIKDWCISRQLWWGQRIPAWYCKNKECSAVVIVQKNKPDSCPHCHLSDYLYQDEDVFDTWFSSWLWPISVFDGFKDPHNKDIQYYYPTNDLVTAPEIMFFWVARMIMAGYAFRGEKPFRNVYYTGIVRDKQGRKMSKSLGNSPDPLELIKQYSADGVRVGMLFSAPAGNDLLFDESLCEQGRNFANKIWNAYRLIQSWKVAENKNQDEVSAHATEWFDHCLQHKLKEVEELMAKFRISDALITIYKLIWDDFCSWYLEMIKPGSEIDAVTYQRTIDFYATLLKILHPFMPFITEELWSYLPGKEKEFIMVSSWPKYRKVSSDVVQQFETVKEIIVAIRNFKASNKIAYKQPLEVKPDEVEEYLTRWYPIITKMSHVLFVDRVGQGKEVPVVIGKNKFIVLAGAWMNREEEKRKIEQEIKYLQGFLASVEKKLNNPKFSLHAPAEVVEREKKKQKDAQEKLKKMEEILKNISLQ